MHLYNVTIQDSNSIQKAVLGNFSGTKQQEVIAIRSTQLVLLRPDSVTRKLQPVLSTKTFGIIRDIAACRLTGSSKDYIIVSSDSGRIVVLEYNPTKNIFEKIHQETFGKSGCRRIIPGEYVAVDPKGRAVMISAVEKQKLVYILNRDAATRLTISSPLEAHKSHTIVHSCVGVDVGFENPQFACLEIDYSEADVDPTGAALETTEKTVTFYELDLGLNNVVRKNSEVVDSSAHLLFAVPGSNDGPSGVLVCSENYITWKKPGAQEHRVPIPRRRNPLSNSEQGIMIVAGVLQKMKQAFFYFLQSEEGDIYKLTMECNKDELVNLKIKYYDTVPVASSLNILKPGFLFVASEFGNHYMFQIENLGDDDEDQEEFSSQNYMNADGPLPLVYFKPHELRNLALIDEMENFSPLIDCKIANLTEDDTPQFYSVCGKGPRSSLRILRNGLEVTEMAVSDLPGTPNAVWTTKLTSQDQFDAYIIVSFANATLVLSIGDTVEEVTDTGFLTTEPTLDVQQVGEDALVQVYAQGIRYILADKRVNEWKPPSNKTVMYAACNQRQVVLALSGGEIVYFEHNESGQLQEYQERKEMYAPITCLSIGKVPEGRKRCRFLAVGCADNTVRVLCLDPDHCLEALSMQALNAQPHSLAMVDMMDAGSDVSHSTLFLNIGLDNGILLRTTIDSVTGALSDTRARFLGSRAVKLFSLTVHGAPAVLALSSKPWLCYTFQFRFHQTPLAYDTLEFGADFCSDECPEGFVTIAGNTCRILTIEKLDSIFHQTVVPLKYTPRKIAIHSQQKLLLVAEADQHVPCESEKKKVIEQAAVDSDIRDDIEHFENLPVDTFGYPRCDFGKWGSCIQLIHTVTGELLFTAEMDDNEACFVVTTCIFRVNPTQTLVVAGGARDMKLNPRRSTCGLLFVYRITEDGQGLELLHKTETDDVPTALCPFQGRLLVGVGNALRIYDIGKKKMLRKCENRSFPADINGLHTQGDRIVISDVQESVHYATYKAFDNKIIVFADDTYPRWMTASTMVDYETVAGGDKFGNFFVNRLPSDTSLEVDEDPTGSRLVYERGYLNGAPYKLHHEADYFVGDILTSIHRTSLVTGGRDILVYTTLLGSIGASIPFLNREDWEFFQTLEMHMRNESPPLLGRDHLAYRSYYTPVRNVVDGDLCEQFNLLPVERKRVIAEELDRTVNEVSKKLEDIRTKVAF